MRTRVLAPQPQDRDSGRSGGGRLLPRSGRPSLPARLVCWLCVLSLMLPQGFVPGLPAADTAAAKASLQSALARAVTAKMGSPPPAGIVVSALKQVDKWRYGTVAVRVPESAVDRSPEAFLFIARKRGRGWDAAVEGTPGFGRLLDRSPRILLPANVRALFPGASEVVAEGDGAAQLSLPWEVGKTWIMGGGPHSNSGNGTRPRSALDFNARSGDPNEVRAAADGIAFVPCQNFVRINHANGWQTGYYHLTDIAVANNQPVSRGQLLGTAAGATDCGGSSTGPHVHFTLLRNGVHQEINGRDIGGWTVQEGATDYQGCLVKGSATACAANGSILNDGAIGSGTIPTPTPSPTPTPTTPTATPSPTATPTPTRVPPTATPIPPTPTPVPPTATPVPPTSTPKPTSVPTATPVPPTATPILPTATPTPTPTSVPPTPTPIPPTSTPIPPPPAPVLTAPDDGNVFAEGAAIALDWTGVGANVEYVTEIAGGPNGSGSVGPQGASGADVGPLPAGYVYTWRVKARGPGGDSPWSEPRDFSVRLAAPTDLQAEVRSCSEVRLSWRDRSGGEEGYRLFRDGSPVGDAHADESAVVVRNLPENTNHTFTVRAYRADQQSAASDPAPATTPACAVNVDEPPQNTTGPTALSLSPPTGARGETVAVTASGYEPGEKVTVTWDQGQQTKTSNKPKHTKKGKGKKGKKRKNGNPNPETQIVTMGTAIAAANGGATLTFNVPQQAAVGGHRVEGVGSEGNRAAVTFEVIPGAPRVAARESASDLDRAANDAGSHGDAGNSSQPSPTGAGENQALLPDTGTAVADGPPKRKPGKSRDRTKRDDKGKDKGHKKHSRGGQRHDKHGRTERQRHGE